MFTSAKIAVGYAKLKDPLAFRTNFNAQVVLVHNQNRAPIFRLELIGLFSQQIKVYFNCTAKYNAENGIHFVAITQNIISNTTCLM